MIFDHALGYLIFVHAQSSPSFRTLKNLMKFDWSRSCRHLDLSYLRFLAEIPISTRARPSASFCFLLIAYHRVFDWNYRCRCSRERSFESSRNRGFPNSSRSGQYPSLFRSHRNLALMCIFPSSFSFFLFCSTVRLLQHQLLTTVGGFRISDSWYN